VKLGSQSPGYVIVSEGLHVDEGRAEGQQDAAQPEGLFEVPQGQSEHHEEDNGQFKLVPYVHQVNLRLSAK